MKKLNLVPILKDCPKGMKLNCPLFDNVQFSHIDKKHTIYPIRCYIKTKYGQCAISFTKYGQYQSNNETKCVIFPKGKTTWEGFKAYRLKNGDIVVNASNENSNAFIYAGENDGYYSAYGALTPGTHPELVPDKSPLWVSKESGIRLATEEEKEILFKAIKDNGYRWNAETKTLEIVERYPHPNSEKIQKTTFTVTKIENPKADWKRVLKAARKTVGKKDIDKEPSDEFKRQMLLAEHSPIRLLEYDIDIDDVAQWITVHYVRHHIGIEKFIYTQRTDRNPLLKGLNRDELPQGMLTNMMLSCNAQSIINISRKRLCTKASEETREVWKAVLAYLKELDPILVEKCVPECLYRGFCPEKKCCGFVNTTEYLDKLNTYRRKHDDAPKQD